MVFVVSAMEDRSKRAEFMYVVLSMVLVKLALTTEMIVMYPTRDLDLGLLFLYMKDFDFADLEGDPDIEEFLSTIPEPKFLPIPKAPPITTDSRFELLRQ